MNTANATFRFLKFGRAQPAHPADDAADMGTCFGLEMSFDDPAPQADLTEPPAPSAWWRRLANRRRTQD